MTDEHRFEQALALLRQHLREVQEAHQLSSADCVRLASALLSAVLADGRSAGVDESTLQALDREGESLAGASDASAELKSEAAAELVAEIAREGEAEEERPDTIVVSPREVEEESALLEDDELAFYELPPPLEDSGPIEEVLVGLELLPESAQQVETGLRPGALRRHPRFLSRTEVLVAVAGRDELRALWTRDIGSGGLFVSTGEPPPQGTSLAVTLRTPDGELQLHGRVVHTIDGPTAEATGSEPGVGIEFTDLTDGRRRALEHYIDGLNHKLRDEAAAEAAASGDERSR
ncbi:MAG: PilZ domain-containing protein [Deltaproteobacteria bacterium]|nr:PilZ domain-containing protein [Deltaproteobacteria bacterium]